MLKAFGYGNYSIGFHYLKLAFVVVLGGIALGIGVGWYFGLKITELYMEFFRFPVLVYQPGPSVITSAVLISLGSAAIGAVVAVKRAGGLPPAEPGVTDGEEAQVPYTAEYYFYREKH